MSRSRKRRHRKPKPVAAKLLQQIKYLRRTLKPRKLVQTALYSKPRVFGLDGVDLIAYSPQGKAMALIRMFRGKKSDLIFESHPLKKNPDKIALLQTNYRHGPNVFYYKNSPDFVYIYSDFKLIYIHRDYVNAVINALHKYVGENRDTA